MANVSLVVVGGSGLIGKRHCQHVVDNPRTSLLAIIDPSPAAAEVAARFSVPLYPSISEVVNDPGLAKPAAAIVCTPNHTHVPISLELLRLGIHVLCEKPISSKVEDARKLISEASVSNARLLIGHHRRFNPYMVAMRKALDSGMLGNITAVSGLWMSIKPSEYFAGETAKWRSDRARGGGVILINFIHEIDLLQYLLGPVVRVHAEKTINRRGQSKSSSNGPDTVAADVSTSDLVEEGAALTLRFESGVVGTFLICDNVASAHNFESGTGENPMIPKSGSDVYRIFGTKGTLSFPDMKISRFAALDPSWTNALDTEIVTVENPDAPPLDAQLSHFVDVCEGKEPPSCTGVDGLRALLVCEAIRKALEKGDFGTETVEQITP